MKTPSSLVAAALLLASCGGSHHAVSTSSASPGESMISIKPVTWTGATAHYGAAVGPQAGITYQPDVVFVGGGPESVRSVSGNGLLWTIDASAPNATDLAIGKMMMLTSFGTGRVLAVKHVGGDLQVLLGPASITDIVRDGTFASTAPIPISKPLYYSTDFTDQSAQHSMLAPPIELAALTRPLRPMPRFAAPLDHSAALSAGQYHMSPICCSGGLGVHFSYDNGQGRLSATVQLQVGTPTVSFHISVGGGHLVDASVYLHGSAALKYDLKAATKSTQGNVKGVPINVPGGLVIPISGPFNLTLTQNFIVTMQLGGAASLITHGSYRVSGDLGFGTTGGKPDPSPVSMSASDSPVKHVIGIGIAANALSLGWNLRATVGAGIPGLTFGIWGELDTGIALANDGQPFSPTIGCSTTSLDVGSRFGVGYRMPQFIATVVNAFIGLFGAKPIPAVGGVAWGPFPIWNPPPDKYCIPRTNSGG